MESSNFLADCQEIKWAHDGKEGIILLTSLEKENKKLCEEDNDCKFCSLRSVCLKELVEKSS